MRVNPNAGGSAISIPLLRRRRSTTAAIGSLSPGVASHRDLSLALLVCGPLHHTHNARVVRRKAEGADVLLEGAGIQLIPDQAAVQAGMGVLVADEDRHAEHCLEKSSQGIEARRLAE